MLVGVLGALPRMTILPKMHLWIVVLVGELVALGLKFLGLKILGLEGPMEGKATMGFVAEIDNWPVATAACSHID